jgi:hypothetical protein
MEPVRTTPVVVVPSQRTVTTTAPVVVEREVVTTTPSTVTVPSTTVAVPSTARVISYPEGRYELRGDATTGYYWVWMPAGVTIAGPPLPPALPRVTTSSSPVVVSQVQREVRYADGRYELQGDSTAGYYWVWIPATYSPPAAPPRPPRVGQGP